MDFKGTLTDLRVELRLSSWLQVRLFLQVSFQEPETLVEPTRYFGQ